MDYTPREIKKLINQIKINYYSNIDLLQNTKNKSESKYPKNEAYNEEVFFMASLFVSSAQIFNNEKKLLKLIQTYKKNNNNEKINNIKNELGSIYLKIIEKNKIPLDKLIEYINIIYYKMKVPDKDMFIRLINNFNISSHNDNIKNIANYFSIFNNNILLDNLKNAINETLNYNDLLKIILFISKLNDSLEMYSIIFLKNNEITDWILENFFKKINDTENKEKYTHYIINIFNFFIYSNNQEKYKYKILDFLNICIKEFYDEKIHEILNISIYKAISNLLFNIIYLFEKYYKISNTIKNDLYKIFNYYNKTIIDNYRYIILVNVFDEYSECMLNTYIHFYKLETITRKIIFTIVKENIFKILSKGYIKNHYVNDDEIYIDNEFSWVLMFYDIYSMFKLSLNDINKFIKKGLNTIFSYHRELIYFIILKLYYDNSIDVKTFNKYINTLDICKNIDSTTEVITNPAHILIFIINKYTYKNKKHKKYKKYTDMNIRIINNILNKILYYEFELNKNELCDKIIDNILVDIKNKFGDNDEYYKYLYELKYKKYGDDIFNGII